MTTLKGKLIFISFWHPIKLETEDGVLDLRTEYFKVFKNLNDKKTSMDGGMNDLTICVNKDSEYKMKFEKNITEESILMILENADGFGFSNVGAYLPDTLRRLNGMQVIVEVDEDSIGIKHDETEKVFEINYTNNNSCRIPEDKIKVVCKIGQEDCCIFCSVSGDGFQCQKFDSYMASSLLRRHAEGTMNATRIGNCKIVGRIEEKVES